MTFDEVMTQTFGLKFEQANVSYDEEATEWQVKVYIPNVTHSLSATTLDDAITEAAVWLLSVNRPVISRWLKTPSGGANSVITFINPS